MPFSSGTYSLPSGNPVVTGTTISSSTTNTTNSDIATALSSCILKDGTQTITANLPMASHKLTGLSAGTTAGDSVEYAGSPSFTNLAYTGTLTGSTGILNIGSGQVYKDASGNVGIGTSSPAVRLHITDSSAASGTLQLGNTATTGYYSQVYQNGNYLDLIANGDQAYRVSLGTNNGSGNIRFFTATGTTGNTERMRIDSSGNLLVGTTSVLGGTNKLCLLYNGATSGGLLTQTSSNVTYTAANFLNSSGTSVGSILCTSAATSFVPSSDIRLKTNIIPISNGIERVLKLNPVDYNWISDGSLDNGFIAQELLDLPEFKNRAIPIGKADDGSDLYGVDYMKFVSVLTAAIQELKAIIDTQQEQINSLLGK